jgi:hypothetical protein
MLQLGGITGLKDGLKQFALVELRELGPTIVVRSLPSIKFYFRLSTFLVAWSSIALSHAKTSSNCKSTFLVPFSIIMSILKSYKAFRN